MSNNNKRVKVSEELLEKWEKRGVNLRYFGNVESGFIEIDQFIEQMSQTP